VGEVPGEGKDLLKGRLLFLLGFMGAGKSTVGPLLARTLGVPFVDMDALIEERVGKTIEAIFREEGEEVFRAHESALLRELASTLLGGGVVATGGGVVTWEENWEILKGGITVALMASLEELETRLRGSEGRPLLGGDWRRLLREREPLYRRASLVVDTTGLEPSEVVDTIVKALAGRGG
jgi:shikimate kinase